MFCSTNCSFSMLRRHSRSGSPVVADCWRTKSVARLRAVAERQFGVDEQIRRPLDARDQFGGGNVAQHVARPIAVPHVAADDAGARLAHLRHRLAGEEVHDPIGLEALVRLAPAEGG